MDRSPPIPDPAGLPDAVGRVRGLSVADVEARLRARAPRTRDAHGLNPSAVLVLLRDSPEGPEVLLTLRSEDVRDHKGQVSFPGGAAEPGDADETATALRESFEEVGLDPGRVRILGRLDDCTTITGYHVVPVVGSIPDFDGLRARTAEIAEVFAFPLVWMADPAHVQRVPWERGGHREEVLMIPFGPRLVWGATARMLHNLLEILT
jgi:8-oxo-dGTP pyrophosphatase MutT (NUDIX family)